MNRKVLVVTGSRADYGLLRPVMEALRGRATLQVLATGSHLSDDYGSSVRELEQDGFSPTARVAILDDASIPRSIGRAILGIDDALQWLDPAVVVVLGDRYEALAAAIAAVYGHRILAHIHGGDRTGGYDEHARHAITKFAHLHFAASPQSAERLRRLGEEEFRIHLSGAPGLDTVLNAKLPTPADVRSRYGLAVGPFILLAVHPLSTRPSETHRLVRTVLDGCQAVGLPILAVGSNADEGGTQINDLLSREPNVKFHLNLPHSHYLALLQDCAVLVGNSSSGIIEAPSFGVPVVNVGSRQEGRERAGNVVDCVADADAIERAIRHCLVDQSFLTQVRRRVNPYGDGRAGQRIAKTLAETVLDERLRSKRITY